MNFVYNFLLTHNYIKKSRLQYIIAYKYDMSLYFLRFFCLITWFQDFRNKLNCVHCLADFYRNSCLKLSTETAEWPLYCLDCGVQTGMCSGPHIPENPEAAQSAWTSHSELRFLLMTLGVTVVVLAIVIFLLHYNVKVHLWEFFY